MKKNFFLTGLLLGSVFLISGCTNQSQAHKSLKRSHIQENTTKSFPNNKILVNYNKPSQNKPYPKLNKTKNRIVVSIKDQRVYIQRKFGHTWATSYTMYVSTGSHNRTPKGQYRINGVKTKWFYSPQEHEGAQYGTGWHDGGVYLFHATPANQHHQIFQNVAKDLGRKPSSHGCVHLTIPDAKYIYNNAPTGMIVIIK